MALFCVVVIKRDFVSLLRFPFLSHVQVFSCEMLFINRLKRLWSCYFFPFLFSSYCHSVGRRVVRIVSDGCTQSFYVLLLFQLNLIFSSSILNKCLIFLPTKLPSNTLSNSSEN